ncbi:MerR family transcriptional regulator [Streptomyces fuscigenes]|uniref:MerR family transcriptional regulator n=1 Tax=Streptomyces fuscigenes TaxID=1528880 RepID=UPI001F4450A4|nr:MerR family transcriptional regulator [Streptomyces fuscigenes]MCF3963679.1 MerR family transcriptional regulator [Streptomyces fuscigenes]
MEGREAATDGDGAPRSCTVDELAARAGVSVRTVRFYSTRGLLPPPELGPRRVGRYGPAHLARLALIEELRAQGMTLAAIERYVARLPEGLGARDLAIHRALVASWAPDGAERATRTELERRAGRPLADEDVERLAAMGALAPVADAPGAYLVDAAMLRLGVELLDVPIERETILAARAVLMEHTRAAAHELTRLFRDEVWAPRLGGGEDADDRAAAVRSLSEPLRPLVLQALVTAFQRSLTAELRDLADGADTEAAGRGPGPGTETPGAAPGPRADTGRSGRGAPPV